MDFAVFEREMRRRDLDQGEMKQQETGEDYTMRNFMMFTPFKYY
jgi:hypothetical protein